MKKQKVRFISIESTCSVRIPVWSAHTSTSCNMSEQIVIMHNGVKVLETVFRPEAKQPRAYMLTQGTVTVKDGVTVVEL